MPEIKSSGRKLNVGATSIGAHADCRAKDYVFARTQSLTLGATKWGSRIRPLRGWGELVIYGAAVFVLVAVKGLTG